MHPPTSFEDDFREGPLLLFGRAALLHCTAQEPYVEPHCTRSPSRRVCLSRLQWMHPSKLILETYPAFTSDNRATSDCGPRESRVRAGEVFPVANAGVDVASSLLRRVTIPRIRVHRPCRPGDDPLPAFHAAEVHGVRGGGILSETSP